MPYAELQPEPVPPNRELPRAGSCFSPTETALGIGAVVHWHSFVFILTTNQLHLFFEFRLCSFYQSPMLIEI